MPGVRFPHCDADVLHAPGQCEYCDEFPHAQTERVLNRVNFTGESREGFSKCPSEARRPVEIIHAWAGNRPAQKQPPREYYYGKY